MTPADRKTCRWAALSFALAMTAWTAASQAKGGFWERVLDFLGVTVGSGQTKSALDAAAGRLITKDLVTGAERPLTSDGGYRWPIFSADGQTVYALRGDQLVMIPLAGGQVTPLRKVDHLDKLVGADRQQADQILVLRRSASAPVAVLSLRTGKLTPLPFDRTDDRQVAMLSRLAGEERVYGGTRIFVQAESAPALSGEVTWQEIYLQGPDGAAHRISACARRSCRHPALSGTAAQAVWIRLGDDAVSP